MVFPAGGWWRGTLGKVAIKARVGSSRKGEVESCEVESWDYLSRSVAKMTGLKLGLFWLVYTHTHKLWGSRNKIRPSGIRYHGICSWFRSHQFDMFPVSGVGTWWEMMKPLDCSMSFQSPGQVYKWTVRSNHRIGRRDKRNSSTGPVKTGRRQVDACKKSCDECATPSIYTVVGPWGRPQDWPILA